MKKLLTIAMMTAAVSALAAESSNTFGILRVTIPAGQQNTIIAAPWCDAGAVTTDAQKSIKVKDIVKTANLTPATTADNGDKIYVFNGKSYSSAFQLQTVAGVVKWVGISINEQAAASDDTAIQRGEAIMLHLNSAPNTAKNIYLYGQYTNVAASMTIITGNSSTPAYSLVAPSTTEDTLLDSLDTANVGDDDQVLVRDSSGNARVLKCRSVNGVHKWGTVRKTGVGGVETLTPVSITIPAGEGFWYISRGGSL